MKKMLILSFLMAFITTSYAEQSDKNRAEEIYHSYFFEKKVNSLNFLRQKYQGKYICPPSELDSILKSDDYSISRNYALPNYGSVKDSVVIFLVSTAKRLQGIDEYQKAELFKNNILVVFEIKKDSTYVLRDFFYKPINQGTFSFDDLKIMYKNNSLVVEQYGGNQFGHWGTEFEFEYDDDKKTWILKKYSLYTSIWGEVYQKDKLIWTKTPKERIRINDIYFSRFITYDDLDVLT
jgi:hypothetical protein